MDKTKKVEKQTKRIIVRHRHLSLFDTWIVLGLVMMVLKNTIWPEVDTQLEGFYTVSTLWLTVMNSVCSLVFPYMSNAGEWIVDQVPLMILSIEKNWPFVVSIISTGFKLWLKATVTLLAITVLTIVLFFVTWLIMCLIDRKKALEWMEKAKKFRGKYGKDTHQTEQKHQSNEGEIS